MTGLQKIVAQIESDTDKICADIKARSDKRCEEILFDAKEKAQLVEQKGNLSAEKRYEDILARAKSSAELQSRASILMTKQKCIAEALSSARQYILNLDTKEYFDLIVKMVEVYSEDKKGEIRFSPRDLARIPDTLSENLIRYAKAPLCISDTPADIDGGFIIVYGDIEVNCSFESLFLSRSEDFSDEVSRILF